jgi:carboxymethylenebutenolidase
MCFAADAHPPELPADLALAPLAGAAAAEPLTLTSADGTRFSAALADTPEPRSDTGVVILPDVRGLYRFYEELAERFAQAGYPAIVIDYFGRTAGLGPRDDAFEYWPHTLQTEHATIQADIAAGVQALRERTRARRVVVVGFCFGGTVAFLAAANPDLDLAGAIGFYGGMDPGKRDMKLPSPVDLAPQTRVPVLGLFGGADQGIPAERVAAYTDALADAGVEHDIHVYPGAPHSFFDRKFEEFRAESEDAWRRVLAFLEARATAPR